MAKHSFWMVKVVLLSQGLFLLLILGDATAQSSPDQDVHATRKLSLSYRHAYLDDVLTDLSSEAGVYFVYSADVLEPRIPAVSITIHQQPLATILASLGQQLHLSFRREGKYIIVKKAAPVKPVVLSSRPAPAQITVATSADIPVTRQAPVAEEPLALAASIGGTSLYSSNTPGQRFITGPLAGAPAIRKRGLQWMATAGVFANDFTHGGLELTGGLRQAYLVVNAGLLDGRSYRIGYGAGTSITLHRRWDLQLTYTFARMREQDNFTKILGYGRDGVIIRDRTLHVKLRHQQVKLMTHYRISPRIDLLFGPTFNFIHSRYTYRTETEVNSWRSFFVAATPRHAMASKGVQSFQPGKPEPVTHPAPEALFAEKSFALDHFRIGFEVGLSYRINFLRYR